MGKPIAGVLDQVGSDSQVQPEARPAASTNDGLAGIDTRTFDRAYIKLIKSSVNK